MLIARKDLPANNLQEFIAYTKANQAKMQYGSAGAGSPSHLACALLNAAIGVNVTHVAYRGGGPAMQDLIAGRIDYQCPNAAAAIPQLEGKLVKAIAILTKNRSPVLPNLASAHEQGLKDFEVDNWLAFFLPKGTPTAIIRKLQRGNRCGDGQACRAGAAAGTRRRGGRARAQVARISPELRRARDQEVGRNHQGERSGDELRTARRSKWSC